MADASDVPSVELILCQSLGPRQASEVTVRCRADDVSEAKGDALSASQSPSQSPSLSVAAALRQCADLGLMSSERCAAILQEADGGGLVGIWGRRCRLEDRLSAGDRLELYRPLLVDPKTARRERFKTQGAKTAGLFASRRPGAKPGY